MNAASKRNDLPSSLSGLELHEMRCWRHACIHTRYSRTFDRVRRTIALGRAMSLIVLLWRRTIAICRC